MCKIEFFNDSVSIVKPNRERRAFTPNVDLQVISDYMGPGNEELLNSISKKWTEQVVTEFKFLSLEQEAWDENEYRNSEIEENKKLEMRYAEEQAWIENIVRDLI